MSPQVFSLMFVVAVLVTFGLQLWLSSRQLRHVLRYREAVPADFAGRVSLDAHQRAADYTVAKLRLGKLDFLLGWIVTMAFTLLGGLDVLNAFWLEWLKPGLWSGMALIGSVALISMLVDLPLSWIAIFKVEARFGFNRMTMKLWLLDLLKHLGLSIAIGGPLLLLVLWFMKCSGALWWLYAWAAFVALQFLMMWLYPTVIAPLFNKFNPLADEALKAQIEALMQRCGFKSAGLFVMDGSKRSSHGNAYFSGFGACKRIVFYDTLIDRLAPLEMEAVLAHELGHFKLRHVGKRMLWLVVISLGAFALLGWLGTQAWFYLGLGFTPSLIAPNDAAALLLFTMALPAFTFVLGPVGSWASRKHEFEADEFAAKQSDKNALVNALVKLYEDNGSTLTPDPVYSAFYYSHPPASVRIGRLQAL
jgi:STE24 endopeptidase